MPLPSEVVLRVQPVYQGLDSAKISFLLVLQSGGGTVAIISTPSDFNRFDIVVTVDYTGTAINIGTWEDVANVINTDSSVNKIIKAEGAPQSDFNPEGSQDQAQSSGAGEGTYFAGQGGRNNYVNCGGVLVNAGNFVAMGFH